MPLPASKAFALRAGLVPALLFACLGPVAAADETKRSEDIPPADGLKLSKIVEMVEQRPGFYAFSRISYKENQYEIIYFMKDGAEVHLNYDARTGDVRPPERGLFSG